MNVDQAWRTWAMENRNSDSRMRRAFHAGYDAGLGESVGAADPDSPPQLDRVRLDAELAFTETELHKVYDVQRARLVQQIHSDIRPEQALDTTNRPVLAPILIALAEVQVARARLAVS
jgi:hypothetical protein